MSRLNVANFRHPDGPADNNNLTSTGRVGIGTSSPGRTFQVVDSSNAFLSAKCGSVEGFVNVTSSAVNLESSSSIPVTFSPGGTLRGRFDTSGNLQFNSGYGSVATAYGVRAWIHFNGGASTIGTGDASRNVSSVTDNGTGDYTINFSNNMPDANYCIFGSATWTSTYGAVVFVYRDTTNGYPSSSAFRIAVNGTNNYTANDAIDIMVGVVR